MDVKGRQRYRAEAKLVRVSCSAPPEVPASAAGPGLWFVPLEGGDTLRMGRLLPEGFVERAGDVSYRIAGTPTGIFSAAREVRVQLTLGGAVADVRLRYPLDASLDSLVAVFRDTLGAPHSDDRTRLTRVLWLTGTTDLELHWTDNETWVFLGRPGIDWGLPPGHELMSRGDSTGGDPR